jgi:hypothetical protein
MAVDRAEQRKMTGLRQPERLRPVITSVPGSGSRDAGSPWPHRGALAAMAAPSPAETIPPALRAPALKKPIIKLKIKKPQELAAGVDAKRFKGDT